MGNKDEKTFKDIFASAKNEEDTNLQSFEDILNSSSIDEIANQDTTSLTFDNLFDNVELTREDELSTTESEEQAILDGSTITSQEESTFNNINQFTFDNYIDNVGVEENSISQDILTTEMEIPAISSELPNPFFATNNNESDITKASDYSENIDKAEMFSNTYDKNLVDNNNPFFQSIPQETPNNTIEEYEQKETNNKIDLSINPFMNIETSNESILTAIPNNNEMSVDNSIVTDSQDENPFFSEAVQISNSTTMIETNPFFSATNDTLSEKNISNLNNNDVVQEESQSQFEESTVQSTSPFFHEEQNVVENPLFQNQINLIENQLPNTPNSSIDTTKSKHYNVKIVKKKEPLIKVIVGVLSYALFIWLLLIGITLLIYVLDIKIKEAKGDYSPPTFNAYVVLTGSMLPDIQVRDVVVTKKIDAADLKEGDVITFASADTRYLDTIITHRIIKKNPPTETEGYTFQTKGDNNNVADNALVPENRIFGKVILKIPKLGYLQEFLAKDGGWIVVILIPCLTVMSYDIVKLIKGIKRKKYKNIKVQK